jgi:HEAT repeat protein
MAGEIDQRIEQIPYQHREELLQNLLWLAQTGEQTIPAVLDGLRHDNPKVRSSCAWVLGRLRDRRTIPNLQAAVQRQRGRPCAWSARARWSRWGT